MPKTACSLRLEEPQGHMHMSSGQSAAAIWRNAQAIAVANDADVNSSLDRSAGCVLRRLQRLALMCS